MGLNTVASDLISKTFANTLVSGLTLSQSATWVKRTVGTYVPLTGAMSSQTETNVSVNVIEIIQRVKYLHRVDQLTIWTEEFLLSLLQALILKMQSVMMSLLALVFIGFCLLAGLFSGVMSYFGMFNVVGKRVGRYEYES
jgi:hypothetical protein